MAWSGEGRVPHVDLARVLTGGAKLKLVHMAEYAAAVGVPCKLAAAPYSVARLAKAGEWSTVEEIVESDVITTGCLTAKWPKTHDRRAEAVDIDTVIDRLLRQFAELRPDRRYRSALTGRRARLFEERLKAG